MIVELITVLLILIVSGIVSGIVCRIVCYGIKQRCESNERIAALIVNALRHYSEIHREWIEYQATNGPKRFTNNPESSPRTAEKESTGDEDRSAMAIGPQPEDYLSKISKGTKTAVSFGEDVSE